MLGQQYHEKILRSHLEKMGTVVEFGSELKGFEQCEDHVTVRIVHRSHGEESLEETQVPWLVGADGAHSIVRKTLALPFLGETREADEMVVGDIKVKSGLEDHKAGIIIIYIISLNLILSFYVVYGEMGHILEHVRCKGLCYILPHIDLSIGSCYVPQARMRMSTI